MWVEVACAVAAQRIPKVVAPPCCALFITRQSSCAAALLGAVILRMSISGPTQPLPLLTRVELCFRSSTHLFLAESFTLAPPLSLADIVAIAAHFPSTHFNHISEIRHTYPRLRRDASNEWTRASFHLVTGETGQQGDDVHVGCNFVNAIIH